MDEVHKCPRCGREQDSNGLIAWCENGHIETLRKDDPRYSAQ